MKCPNRTVSLGACVRYDVIIIYFFQCYYRCYIVANVRLVRCSIHTRVVQCVLITSPIMTLHEGLMNLRETKNTIFFRKYNRFAKIVFKKYQTWIECDPIWLVITVPDGRGIKYFFSFLKRLRRCFYGQKKNILLDNNKHFFTCFFFTKMIGFF